MHTKFTRILLLAVLPLTLSVAAIAIGNHSTYMVNLQTVSTKESNLGIHCANEACREGLIFEGPPNHLINIIKAPNGNVELKYKNAW